MLKPAGVIADTVGISALHDGERVVVRPPCAGIIGAGVISSIRACRRGLRPFALATVGRSPFPRPHHPARLACERLQCSRQMREIAVEGWRFLHHGHTRTSIERDRFAVVLRGLAQSWGAPAVQLPRCIHRQHRRRDRTFCSASLWDRRSSAVTTRRRGSLDHGDGAVGPSLRLPGVERQQKCSRSQCRRLWR